VFVAVFITLFGGCSQEMKQLAPPDGANRLRQLNQAYSQATLALKRPPRNAQELRPYLEKMGNANDLMKSPRDNADYVIVWGTDPSKLTAGGGRAPIWMHEAHGQDGKRWVLEGRFVRLLSDDEFRNAPMATAPKSGT
jgi:hypothetical protein